MGVNWLDLFVAVWLAYIAVSWNVAIDKSPVREIWLEMTVKQRLRSILCSWIIFAHPVLAVHTILTPVEQLSVSVDPPSEWVDDKGVARVPRTVGRYRQAGQ